MNNEVERYQNEKKQALERIEMGSKVEQLLDTPIFQEVIMDYFCGKEMVRYADVSGSFADDLYKTNMGIPKENRDNAGEMSRIGGHLKRWMDIQVTLGQMAAVKLPEIENNIAEAMLPKDTEEDIYE